MKMAGAHPRPQSSVDERVFIVLKYTETGKCSGNSQVSKAVSESEDTVQTNNDGQLQQVCPLWFKFEQKRRQ